MFELLPDVEHRLGRHHVEWIIAVMHRKCTTDALSALYSIYKGYLCKLAGVTAQ